MPWVVRDAVDDINRAVSRRWQGLDRMLPGRAELPEGCVGAALVGHAHNVLDTRGVQTTLLHYAQVNPLSAPFWSRMGYRPLWTGWEARPAWALR